MNSGVLECTVQYAPYGALVRGKEPRAVQEIERRAGLQLEQALLPAVLLERYPKSTIECNVLVLSHDGNEAAAIVLASSLALAQAGIELLDLPVAGTVAGIPTSVGQYQLIVDPTAQESTAAVFVSSTTFLPSLGTVSAATHVGSAPAQAVAQAWALAMDTALAVHKEAKAALLQHAEAKQQAKTPTVGASGS